jgi:hypothetical protein
MLLSGHGVPAISVLPLHYCSKYNEKNNKKIIKGNKRIYLLSKLFTPTKIRPIRDITKHIFAKVHIFLKLNLLQGDILIFLPI